MFWKMWKWLGIISLCSTSQALASGMTLHIWKSDMAVELLSDPGLQNFMQSQRAAYRNGAVFPDTGYAINHAYGEYSHWHDFLNSYYSIIDRRCPTLESQDCQQLFAHFLGSLAHTIADINFDRHFVTSAAQIDYQGSIDTSQSWLDTGLDFLAVFEHKRAFQIPKFQVPVQALLEAFDEGGELSVSRLDLLKGSSVLGLGLIFEPVGASFTYFYYKNNMPWAAANYLHARGGVVDSAERIARAWELVWQAFQQGRRDPLFATYGHWPHADFYVAGRWLEDGFDSKDERISSN
ncbi:MAG: zinc dependent phospholipase C family protein [Oligoflexus sp.]